MPAPCKKEASLPAPVVTRKYFWPQPHKQSKGFEKRNKEQRCARGSLLVRARAWRESAVHWGTCGRVAAAAAPPPTPLHPSARTAATTIHTVPPPMPASKGPDNLLERNPTTWRFGGGGEEGSTCAERHWISLHCVAFSFGISSSDQGLLLNSHKGQSLIEGKQAFQSHQKAVKIKPHLASSHFRNH